MLTSSEELSPLTILEANLLLMGSHMTKDGHSSIHGCCRDICSFSRKMWHLQQGAGAWSKAQPWQGAAEPEPPCDVYN